MNKKKQKIEVQGNEIAVITPNEQDYISLTDIAKYKTNDANEADILNMALFGKTAKQWRVENPNTNCL